MSLVGPRPLVMAEAQTLTRVVAGAPRRPAPRPDRPLAGLRALEHPVPRDDPLRLPVRRGLVAGARHRDPPRHGAGGALGPRRVLTRAHPARHRGVLGGHARRWSRASPPSRPRPATTSRSRTPTARSAAARWPTPPASSSCRCGGRAARRRRSSPRAGRCGGSSASAGPTLVHLHSSFAGAVGALALPRGVPLIYTPHGFAFARAGAASRGHRRGARGRGAGGAPLRARRRGLGGGGASWRATGCARRASRSSATASPSSTTALPERPLERGAPAVVAAGRITAQRRPAATARILSALAPVARVALDRRRRQRRRRRPLREAGHPRDRLAAARARRSRASARRPSTCTGRRGTVSRSPSSRRSRATSSSIASDIPANREVVGAAPGVRRRARGRSRSRARCSRTRRCAPSCSPSSVAARRRSAPRGWPPSGSRCTSARCRRRPPRDAPRGLRPHWQFVTSGDHGPEGSHRAGLEAALDRPRRSRHDARQQRARDPLAPDRVRVDRRRSR